jgi:hypothetical protein
MAFDAASVIVGPAAILSWRVPSPLAVETATV